MKRERTWYGKALVPVCVAAVFGNVFSAIAFLHAQRWGYAMFYAVMAVVFTMQAMQAYRRHKREDAA